LRCFKSKGGVLHRLIEAHVSLEKGKCKYNTQNILLQRHDSFAGIPLISIKLETPKCPF
jgi:hypothetical protein